MGLGGVNEYSEAGMPPAGMKMGVWDCLRLIKRRGNSHLQSVVAAQFELLEPRVLLNAGYGTIEAVLPPDPPAIEQAIVVDLEVESGPVDAACTAPVLPGLELVDPDLSELPGQVIYLDFDGAEDVVYSAFVAVEPFDVPPFVAPGELRGQEEIIIAGVVDDLEQTFVGSGVIFTAERPVEGLPYSTIYVGGDDWVFADYGSFLGLAEAVDVRNQDRDDQALVFSRNIGCAGSDQASYVLEVASAIAHEAGHLLGYAHAGPMTRTLPVSAREANAAGPLRDVAQFAGPDDGESATDNGPVHQWLTYNAFLFYESQFAGSELADFIGDWTDYGSKHHRTNGDDNDVIEGTFDEDVSAPITYIFDDGFHWDIVRQNPLGQNIPYYRHFVAGGDGDEIYDGWQGYASAVTQALAYWDDYVLDNYPADKALAYYYLGHVAHLLEDMTVPAHVHNDEHPIRDAYEYTMGERSNYLLWGYSDGMRGGPAGDIGTPSDLISLFRETIDYTEEYDSNDEEGDDELEIPNTGRHRPDLVSRSGGFTGDGANLDLSSYYELTVLADDLMPWAMERVAALFRLFYSYLDTTAPVVSFLTSFGSSEENAVLKPSQFHITALAQDDISGYDADGFEFTVERKDATSWEPVAIDPNSGQFQFTAGADGVYRISVEVQDAAGNVGKSETGYFYVDQARPLAEIYRFWSPVNSRHFYTINEAERDKLINNYAHFWTYEGIAYYAFTADTEPEVGPVYRFWSPTLGSHFYTIDEAERNKLVDNYAHVWTYEGVAFYAYADGSQPTGTSAAYRFWAPQLGSHFFTMSQVERDKLLNLYSHVWIYEGICWYAYVA